MEDLSQKKAFQETGISQGNIDVLLISARLLSMIVSTLVAQSSQNLQPIILRYRHIFELTLRCLGKLVVVRDFSLGLTMVAVALAKSYRSSTLSLAHCSGSTLS